MAQGLYMSQKMALSQVLAPQLQQSLELLQAPTLELHALVQQQLQQNPVLEELPALELDSEGEVKEEIPDSKEKLDLSEPPSDVKYDPATEKPSDEPVDDFQAEFEKLAQVDQEWRDHFSQTNLPIKRSREDQEKRQFMFDSIVAETSLQENLLEQLRLSDLENEKMPVAEMLIGNIDDYGYLQGSVDELAFSTNVSAELIEEVLKLIQTFDPVGIGARDLRECLMLQMERNEKDGTLEYRIVRDSMKALGKRRLPEIARGLGVTVDQIQNAVERIGRMEPRPGREFLPSNQQYIVPEVFVEKKNEGFVVTGNDGQTPRLRISNLYKDLMSGGDSNSEVRDYIREKIRAGKFLIKSLHQRQQTILNIANEIVKRQAEFMENGVSQLKPMTMIQVAEEVGVHETTVSRAVSGKYIQTPQGVYEMKYFFTSGIQTDSGAGMSNTSVKGMIAEMFRVENTSKPLSDQEIVQMLKEKGIKIARRTVAKYRSELNILPSNLRKVY
ncbi:MAG TPA: RNA polymerase factor sigma-54 [Verrucomicrobiales bacterium]|nr:RNA polymerase factor sigma-54 [Verrucomicrobiales bacterium]